ncbi:uncharacterized protein BP5553_06895 [Venustampulla echinocandica]|uniref:Myb-like domain-containing protein n=1 Tax=Venustampulla echinocandica TaxID=2656787 RepID=A0A370TL78_9HELO|nr:uncharacterized protein BP5553_06895 [Venustampulla echinocandica]RDL36283.1 hypothetical protein BP5553_06895 [Venustampulla echinocandica]
MSANRSPWSDAELSLLRQVHSENPGAELRNVWRTFSERNGENRSKNAVKSKMKDLGLVAERGHHDATMSTPSKGGSSICSQQSLSMRYNWIAPELPIFMPLHPLIAEARRHAAVVQTVGYASSVSPTTRWASILGKADISGLRCAEPDRAALHAYMEYLQG